jgi:hypothetical protein
MDELRDALMMANVSASFTLESFGTNALSSLTSSAFDARMGAYRRMLGR